MKKEIKVGDFVKWKHRVSKSYPQFNDFIAEGKVEKIFISSLGGKRNSKYVAQILLKTNPYFEVINRRTTSVSLDKLTLSNPPLYQV